MGMIIKLYQMHPKDTDGKADVKTDISNDFSVFFIKEASVIDI